MTRSGEALTVLLLLGGVGTFFYVLSLFVAGVVQAGFARRWEAKRRDRMLDDLRDHFIVCGYGRMGRIIVDEFRRQDVPFVVIDREAELVHELVAAGSLAVAADAGSEDVLRRIGIDYARGLISAVGSDAGERLHHPQRAADASRPVSSSAGPRTRTPSPSCGAPAPTACSRRTRPGAHQMAQAALRPAVVDFVQLATSSERLELGIEQIRLTPASPLCGQSLGRGQRPAALRRGRRRRPAGRRQDGVQPGARGLRCRPAITSS
jgi:voltage-gated potassium channel